MLNIFYIYAYAFPLTRCLLPPPPSNSLDEEVAGDEEGIDDTAPATDVDDTTIIDAVPKDAAPKDATMPPRLVRKPPAGAKKTTKKAESDDVAAVPAPATKPPENYSIDSTEKHFISYYVKGKSDVADVYFSSTVWSTIPNIV